MVGHDPAQVVHARATRVQLHGALLPGRAVVHLRLAQQSDFMRLQALPGAKLLQQRAAGMRERDFSPIGRGIGQHLGALQLQHRGAQARLGQRDGEAQACRARADDEDVAVLHGVCRLGMRESPDCGRTRTAMPGGAAARTPSPAFMKHIVIYKGRGFVTRTLINAVSSGNLVETMINQPFRVLHSFSERYDNILT